MFLIEYVKKYKVTYISVIITFVLGIFLGIFVTFKMPQNEKKEIHTYLQNTVSIVRDNKIDKQSFFKEKLIENLKDIRDYLDFRLYNYC